MRNQTYVAKRSWVSSNCSICTASPTCGFPRKHVLNKNQDSMHVQNRIWSWQLKKVNQRAEFYFICCVVGVSDQKLRIYYMPLFLHAFVAVPVSINPCLENSHCENRKGHIWHAFRHQQKASASPHGCIWLQMGISPLSLHLVVVKVFASYKQLPGLALRCIIFVEWFADWWM
jgi:hypothetical protein